MRTTTTLFTTLLFTTSFAAAAVAQDVHFSIDWESSTIGKPSTFPGAPITEGDILTVTGGAGAKAGPIGTPDINIPHDFPGLSLMPGCAGHPAGTPCGVEVDALSYGVDRWILDTEALDAGSVWFSTDEWAVSFGVPALPNLVSEAPVGDSSADAMTNMAPLPPGPLPPFSVPPGHVGAIDGDGLLSLSGFSYPGLGLDEPNAPAFGPHVDGDNLDALNLEVPTFPGHPATGVYFSLDAGWGDPLEGFLNSGSAPAHGFSAGDILLSPAPGAAPVVWAAAPMLGLDLAGGMDDLDALVIWENTIPGFQVAHCPYAWTTGTKDMVLFSVRRGSPVIGMPDSFFGIPIEEGDVLCPPLATASGGVSPFPAIFIAAENLGLATARSGLVPAGFFADDLDALDVTSTDQRDCNGNGVEDSVEIALGATPDLNKNGVPDTCEPGLLVNPYCFCDEAAPCGNEDPFAGCENTTGSGALLAASGSTSVILDDFVLTASGMAPGAFGIPFMGPDQIAPMPFGDGLRCVGGTLRRFPVVAAGATGTALIGPGLVASSIASFPVSGHITVGSTWNFQHWYRDPGGPCGTAYNVTNAVAATFTF